MLAVDHRITTCPPPLTERQQDVLTLAQRYYAATDEVPSFGWIGRRLGISRQRVRTIRDRLRERGQWLK